jgi:hypothetical protein
MSTTITKTVFRTFRQSGETIAIFPEEPADIRGDFCMSYMQIGQHGAASPMGAEFASITRPATPEEIAPLRRELGAIGYKLAPVLRVSYKMHQARRQNANPSRP